MDVSGEEVLSAKWHKGDDKTVYITVLGDAGVGKTSLISAAATETFPDSPPPVLPPAKLPPDTTPEGVPVVITDTSTRPEDREALEAACRQASVIVLCFRMERLESLRRISSYWMPELKRLNVRVPVLLVGCKSDVRPADQSLHHAVLPIVKAHPQIETCMECSSKKLQFVGEVFYYALKSVVYPIAPLYNPETQKLKPLCARALKRIFILCDQDGDGVLSDEEINEFQMKCFNAPLQPEELAGVKDVVRAKLQNGISNEGFLTLQGFLFLHALFIERGRLETTWAVLTRFGYGRDLRIKTEILKGLVTAQISNPQQPVQLSNVAVKYFVDAFDAADEDDDGALSPKEMEALFSSFPENPFSAEDSDKTTFSATNIFLERTRKGLLTRNGFMAWWHYLSSISPRETLASAMYLGTDNSSLLHHFLEQVKSPASSRLIKCMVYSPEDTNVRPFMEGLISQSRKAYAQPDNAKILASVAPVKCPENNGGDSAAYDSRIMIMRIISLSQIPTIVAASDRGAQLGQCDVAVFAFDWEEPEHFSSVIQGLLSVASASGDSLPCLLMGINPKCASPTFAAEVQMACDNLNIQEPLSYSWDVERADGTEIDDNIYGLIIEAAKYPDLHIPETPSLTATKRHRRMVARATMYLGIATLTGITGYLSYRLYRYHYHKDNTISSERS